MSRLKVSRVYKMLNINENSCSKNALATEMLINHFAHQGSLYTPHVYKEINIYELACSSNTSGKSADLHVRILMM